MMLTSTAPDLVNISMPNAAIVAVLGYAVVFFGLILLMIVVMAMGKIFIAKEKKAAQKAAEAKVGIDAVPVAPHTKGEIVLPGVSLLPAPPVS